VIDLKSIFFKVLVQVQQKIKGKRKVAEWSKVIDCKSIDLFYMGSNPIFPMRTFLIPNADSIF
jgi:hypothetical protein